MDVTTHPIVDRLLRRLLALTPAEWAQLDATLSAWFIRRGYTGEPPLLLRWVGEGAGAVLRVLPIPTIAFRFFGDWLQSRDGFGLFAPRWRRDGTGPLRFLIERMRHPDFPQQTRVWLPSAVHLAYHRAQYGGGWQAEFYEPLEGLIPWATLVAEASAPDNRSSLT